MHTDMTPQEAVDTVAASAREIGAAQAALSTRVTSAPGMWGREAARIARVLENEAQELNAALSTLRKFTRSEQQEAVERVKGKAP